MIKTILALTAAVSLTMASCANMSKTSTEPVSTPVVEDDGPLVTKTLHIDTVPQGAGIWVMFNDGYKFQGYSPVDVQIVRHQNYWDEAVWIKAVPTAPEQHTQLAYTWSGSRDSWAWTLFMYNTEPLD